MSINRIQKLLFSEYCDFEDMVLVESPFAETTRDGKGLRQVHLGLTPSKLVLATDIIPIAEDTSVTYMAGVDPDIETFELIAVYPIDCVNLSVFHRRKRQSLKARFCNNKILYFELGGFEKRNMFWNLWCEKVKFLNPQDPSSSHSETSVATSTTNSTLYLISSKRFAKETGVQLWCRYASADTIGITPPKWTDKHLYLGKHFDESPLKYTPGSMHPTVEQFVRAKRRKKTIFNNKALISSLIRDEFGDVDDDDEENDNFNFMAIDENKALINRFSMGVTEKCEAALCLPNKKVSSDFLISEESSSVQSIDTVLCMQFEEEKRDKDLNEMAETAVQLWEFYKTSPSSLSKRERRHRRRFAISPQPHFFHGLGPWNVNHGERFSLQMKRAVSVVAIKRQPLEAELRLSISKRQLIASISCETLYKNEKWINNSNNIIRMPPKLPMILFWTPEYWYRPRSAKDSYQELQEHMKKIRLYHQRITSKARKRRLSRLSMSYRRRSVVIKSPDENTDTETDENTKRNKSRRLSFVAAFRNSFKSDKELYDKETSLQFLKRVLKMEISLTAWDFDSNTLAYQLTLIDKELFLKVTPSEFGILLWQQSSKNAPNIGALIAFSHRISCLVVTEILKDDSEKIRARLVARLINTAEKCNKIANFQSCRSVLCGLQSPPIYRLYSMWTYIRKRHSSKYETFEKLCRIYRDPRLSNYQKTFYIASKDSPCLPFIGDLIGKLLDRIPEYDCSVANTLGIKIAVKQKKTILTGDEKRDDIPSLLRKLLSSMKMWQPEPDKDECKCDIIPGNEKINQFKSLSDYYKPLDYYEDNRLQCLEESIELLEKYQKSASHYIYTKNDLAREYLLKARYREDKENFAHSFTIEALNTD
ncbi:PREDICTED: uncharacterized protein LOC108559845 [Nicrophorus vespilloides]|uniref:Uncharacterized protein LOC108559845 n=1 Tax=Nicrophorus vespilloides TaxID=110193 RepID=A0ABM1MDP9_NICVS|nr:PREDICTED: uncharacterized protein LOC108559845 [Nicrophorus vespilloides]